MSSAIIGDYLIDRLVARGTRHVFGVPGDYVLGFFRKLVDSPLRVVNMCDEQGAGFAADAYARLTGLGVVVVTYSVGGLKVANTTAEAYAEKSPVLVISGAPGRAEELKNPLLHHKVDQFDTQRRVFEHLTVASADLNDPDTALREIDRVLAAIERTKRPGYLELPRDMVSVRGERAHHRPPVGPRSDPDALAEAVQEATAMLSAARRPVILAGEEVQRFGLESQVIQLAEACKIPLAVSILGKSAVPETHPLYMGVYAGALGEQDVQAYVESSDCLLLLGVFMTDLNLGVFTAHLEPRRCVHATVERVAIAHHSYPDVSLTEFLAALIRGQRVCHSPGQQPHPRALAPFEADVDRPIGVQRLFACLASWVDCNTVIVADVGDALFGATGLTTCRSAQFLSPAYYTSLGFAVPGSVGAQLARPALRPLVLVGDGAFQMTGMELSTAVRYGLNPIVVVLDNAGYATERPMLDGPFNDILRWRYDRLPEILGQGRGFRIETEGQLAEALHAARDHTESFCILDVLLEPGDISPALQRLTAGMRSTMQTPAAAGP
jgi:TPP-dependent 2-oxoacid decarboxylase